MRILLRRASEAARRTLCGVLAALLATPPVWAAPQGEQVVAGTADFVQEGNLTTITTSDQSIITYDSFDIAAQETVRFLQPNEQSRVLNRILSSGDGTQIDGTLLANGHVYIVDPSGVFFGEGAIAIHRRKSRTAFHGSFLTIQHWARRWWAPTWKGANSMLRV